MTDIRKHGFDSDEQWREHLEEIEEDAGERDDMRMQDDLRALHADVALLHERVAARRLQRANTRRGVAKPLILLVAATAAFINVIGR